MSEARTSTAGLAQVRLSSLALPAEHGGWGMLGEALLLGLLAAPSVAGLGVGLAALGAFLAHHPLKLALADRRRGTLSMRTAAAERLALVYGTAAAAGLDLAARRGAPGWWVPLVLAAPLVLVQLAYETGHHGRRLVPELAGGVALSSVAAAVMAAAGLPLGRSLAAAAVLAARTVSAILYVRARVRRDRDPGRRRDGPLALGSHAAGLALGAVLAAAGAAPGLVVPAFALLLARCAHGLSRFDPPARPQVVGIRELAYGLLFVLAVATGYRT